MTAFSVSGNGFPVSDEGFSVSTNGGFGFFGFRHDGFSVIRFWPWCFFVFLFSVFHLWQ
jgi:hypothetical protein